MVVYLVCLSNLCYFSIRRTSKIFVISSDCLLTSAQQVHDPPCSGLSSKKWEAKQKKPYKRAPEILHASYYILLLGDRGRVLKDRAKLSDRS